METLGKDLAIDIDGNVPVAQDRFVRDVHGCGPDPAGGEHPGPVVDHVPGPVRHPHVDGPRHGGLHLGGEHDGAELDRVARLVDGLVRLDEHGVALVLVLEGSGLRPGDGAQPLGLEPVVPLPNLPHTESDQLGLAWWDSGALSDLYTLPSGSCTKDTTLHRLKL